jgi:hypothetical protein
VVARQAFVRQGTRSTAVAVAAACVVFSGCARRQTGELAPVATLATTRQAQEAFRPLRQRWMVESRERRKTLEPELAAFVSRYPKDGLVLLADVYLALIAVDRGDMARADRLVRLALGGPEGTTRDLAEVAHAAILRRTGEPVQALDRLVPLIGKLIDPYARVLFDEELIGAAIAAQRWYEAVAYLDIWLRDALDVDAVPVRAEVEKILAVIPNDTLERMLQVMTSERSRTGYGNDLRQLIGTRLAAVAVQQGDTELARRLVDTNAAGAALADVSEGLEELASSGGNPRVDGRKIGLLVSPGASRLGPRSAEVLSGRIDALRHSAAEASFAEDHVRLATRDAREVKQTDLALVSLASQGATVLVAGLDAAQADVAAAFSARTKIPVILFSRPDKTSALSSSVFVLADDEERVAALLASALVEKKARVVATVGAAVPRGTDERAAAFVDSVACEAAARTAGEPRFPVASWRAANVDSLLLLGDAPCGSDAVDEALSAGMTKVRAAAGLLAASMASAPARIPIIFASAGRFPARQGDPIASGYVKRNGAPPGWFAALGHDAAMLARAALDAVPERRVEDPAAVARFHAEVRRAMASAETDLWSTDARGFGGGNAIAREWKVVEAK